MKAERLANLNLMVCVTVCRERTLDYSGCNFQPENWFARPGSGGCHIRRLDAGSRRCYGIILNSLNPPALCPSGQVSGTANRFGVDCLA
jgi:hypothetical protein